MSTKFLSSLRPTNLKQKTTLFILVPTFLIMMVVGGVGLHLVRQVLLEQWQETAIAKLQRSAHIVDMRLMRPKQILRFIQDRAQKDLQWTDIRLLIEQLQSLEGVVQVFHELHDQPKIPMPHKNGMRMMQNKAHFRLGQLTISPPTYSPELQSETVSIFAQFTDNLGSKTGYIEVVLSFYDLIDQIVKSPWWKSNKAFIVDQDQNILASTVLFQTKSLSSNKEKFGTKDSLEIRTWKALRNKKSGTVFSPGRTPKTVSGFYRLTEAPWTLIIMAPGDKVLQPILEFRSYYYITSIVGIFIALLYLQIITDATTSAINRLSTAAGALAKGTFAKPLPVKSRDEVGTLTTNFNIMAAQLKERLRLMEAMHVAREVQQNLLPHSAFITEGLEIAGVTLYCDETGGDYIDLLNTSHENQKATVVVGDVVGHGIGAALLMATVRALLRGRACKSGTIAEIANDVNRQLCRDTLHSNNFVTLFYLEIDRKNSFIHWVRCGHDPAVMYCPDTNTFQDLKGKGIVLGIDVNSTYSENTCNLSSANQIILIASDGVWDVENKKGQQFGKERVKALIAQYHTLSAELLIEKITKEISIFQDGHPQNDDITLAMIKTW